MKQETMLPDYNYSILNMINSILKNYNVEVDNITSVFPTTTTAALTVYYSGKSPIETGWLAWSQYFYVFAYFDSPDNINHKNGWDSQPTKNFILHAIMLRPE